MSYLQKHSALITPNPGPAETCHSTLCALVLLLCPAGGCAPWEPGSGATERFTMQIRDLCPTGQDSSHSTPEPGYGSTRKRHPVTKARELLCPRSGQTSKGSFVLKVCNDPNDQTKKKYILSNKPLRSIWSEETK